MRCLYSGGGPAAKSKPAGAVIVSTGGRLLSFDVRGPAHDWPLGPNTGSCLSCCRSRLVYESLRDNGSLSGVWFFLLFFQSCVFEKDVRLKVQLGVKIHFALTRPSTNKSSPPFVLLASFFKCEPKDVVMS